LKVSKGSCVARASRTSAKSLAPSCRRHRKARLAMLDEFRLNVYVLGSKLSPRQRERIQAQVQTALRSLPPWVFDLLRQRIDALGIMNLPLVIEPQPPANPHQAISLGQIESRPAVKLLPRLVADEIDWGQGLRHLLAKAMAYIVAPDETAVDFWQGWRVAVRDDRLREKARIVAGEYEDETDLGLLIEMFAAYAHKPAHRSWAGLPKVQAFLVRWRATAG
jgi:hypothetical protein